ncbi:MAG: HAD-IA family hydrolase [Candidatus Rokubacteria bacterium]|nr:HAD-IA family hydrolase [Candidatus Rokubacteria bacterium]
MTIRAVLFDAGNTLLELDYAAIADRLRAEGHPVTPAAIRAAEHRARVRLDPHLAANASTESRDIFLLYTSYLLEGLGIASDGTAERVCAALREYNPPIGLWTVPAPGARPVLEALAGRGLRLAVVSNSNGSVEAILREVGLLGYLDAVVDSAVVGVEKPDPRIFRRATGALGVEPEEAVHIGDLYSVDVLGARAAGCRAILLDPAGAWPPLDCLTAPDLPAAVRLLDTLD